MQKTQISSTGQLSHSMVHYLFAIHQLKETKGYARITDVAKNLGLTKGSVSIAINNLKKKGLVLEENESKFIYLSPDGHNEVHNILSARTLLYYFFKDFVGVEEGKALNDSCSMEHLMSNETREGLFAFMKNLACTCDDQTGKVKFSTKLDFCQFKNSEEFIAKQMGDSHLPEEFSS